MNLNGTICLRDYFNLPVLKLWAVLQVTPSLAALTGYRALKYYVHCLLRLTLTYPTKRIRLTKEISFYDDTCYSRFEACRSSSRVRSFQPPPQGKRRPNANLDPMPRSFTSASVKKWRLFLLFRRHIYISMMSFWVLTGTYLVTRAWQHYWLTQQWKEHLLVLKVDTVGK